MQVVVETNDFSPNVLTTNLFTVHNTSQNNVIELTVRKQVANSHLSLVHLDIESREIQLHMLKRSDNSITPIQNVIISQRDFTNVA